jgi:hypothetical protein
MRQDPMMVERVLSPGSRASRSAGVWGSMREMIAGDFARWSAMRRLERQWRGRVERGSLDAALRLARRELALSQQLRMLDATRRVFGLWHVAHRPFAITALLAVLIHVAVALAVGAVRIG